MCPRWSFCKKRPTTKENIPKKLIKESEKHNRSNSVILITTIVPTTEESIPKNIIKESEKQNHSNSAITGTTMGAIPPTLNEVVPTTEENISKKLIKENEKQNLSNSAISLNTTTTGAITVILNEIEAYEKNNTDVSGKKTN